MDGLVLFIVLAAGLVAAVWLLALALAGGAVLGTLLLRGYLGGSAFRLIGLALLTLAVLPLGLGAAFLIGWLEQRELNEMAEAELRRS